jgi:hypothetical protein
MAMRGTPQEIAAKWATRLSGSTQEITAGIDRVTEAPGRKAAAKAGKWHAAVTQAKDKYQRNVGRVSLEDWRQAFKTVGVPRIAQGAQQKQGKVASYMAEVAPHIDAGLARLASMDDSTFEARVQRSVAWQNHMHQFKRSAGGGA